MKKLLIGLTGLVMGASANAGVVFESKTTYQTSNLVEDHQMMVEGGSLKMEIGSDEESSSQSYSVSESAVAAGSLGGGAVTSRDAAGNGSSNNDVEPDYVIYNAERDRFYVIDHARREYIDVSSFTTAANNVANDTADENQRGGLGGLFSGLPKEGQKALKDLGKLLTDGAREMAKQQAAANRHELRRVGDRATYNGYPCERYDVYRAGEKIQELWVTDWDNLLGGDEVRAVFAKLEAHTQSLTDGFGIPSALGTLVTEDGGFPIVTRDFEGGELESETVLESVRERDLDPDAFEPPKGYRLRTSPF